MLIKVGLCSFLFRQEFPANGPMTVSGFYWRTLTKSVNPLLRYIILPSHFLLLHLGCGGTMGKNSLAWPGLRDFHLSGDHVYVQSH